MAITELIKLLLLSTGRASWVRATGLVSNRLCCAYLLVVYFPYFVSIQYVPCLILGEKMIGCF